MRIFRSLGPTRPGRLASGAMSLAMALLLGLSVTSNTAVVAPSAASSPALGQAQVALGWDFGCAVISGGYVQCWGANANATTSDEPADMGGNSTFHTNYVSLARV